MGLFERFLTLWVALCILVGIGLGQLFPTVFQTIGRLEVASVNLPELGLSAIAFALLFVLRLGMLPMLGVCALLGMTWTLLL